MRFVLQAATVAAALGVAAGAAAVAAARPIGLSTPAATRNVLLPPLRIAPDPLAFALQTGGEPTPETPAPKSKSSKKDYVLPVLLSAIVPGAGEIAAGHPWRGAPLLAIDAATWISYAHFQNEGKEWRTRYEQFADAHWHYSGDANGNGMPDPSEIPGWQENLETYFDLPDSLMSPLDWWNPEAPHNCNCPYVTKEEDRQHYYENIGKYAYYWMGWEDWEYIPGSPDGGDSRALRVQYYDMRTQSNDNFDRSTQMIVLGMATRLVSVVQTVLLVRSDQRAEQEFSLQPVGFPGRGAGVAMRLKY